MRMRACILTLIALIALAAVTPGRVHAAWLENGTGLCTATDHQLYVQMIRSEDGTYIATWHDKRSSFFDIYAQKFDADGNAIWTPNGVLVQGDSPLERYPRLVTDGAGGAIILWEDFRSGMELYAQRIDADGNKLWSTYGEPVCTASSDQQNPRMIPDGAGGAIIVWEDWRGTYYDLYIQRIDGNGDPYWTVNGEPLCTTSTDNRMGPELVTDGNHGAIVTWYENRSGSQDIFAQRVGSAGSTLWAADGEVVCSAAQSQSWPRIVSDGFDGAIIAWIDYRSSIKYDIYAQRITLAGAVQWAANGVPICTADYDADPPVITTDGSAGAIVAWTDYRSGTEWAEVYAQRIDVYGAVQWTADGISVCTAIGDRLNLAIDDDGFGGALLAWEDYRAFGGDIYSQKIDGSGAPIWSANGVAVCTADGSQNVPAIVTDGEGGSIVAWHDWRSGVTDIYMQRIERSGYWGYPAPQISGVRDIPGDEGGCVNLSWDASRLDPWPYMQITSYTVWRAIDPAAAMLMIDEGARLVESAADVPISTEPQLLTTPPMKAESPGAPVIRRELLGSETYYWYLIDTVDPYYLPSYSAPEPTMFDSTSTSDEYHYFQVIAHTDDPSVFWISPPDSGYSVDNLSPCPPLGLAGEQSFVPEGLQLAWDPNIEPDLDCYAVYRGTDPGFTPGPGNLLTEPCDTFYFDDEWRWDSGYCYKVAAIDMHGNESECALLCSDNITGDETPKAPAASFLKQNHPNPFNPMTTISFGLSEPANVSLRIYDAAGRLVRTLIDEHRAANRYEITWDGRDGTGRMAASGIYFYRLDAGAFTQTKKMVLLR